MPAGAEYDFRHEASAARLELKAARSRIDGMAFQYIRPDAFDLCVFLGWRPDTYSYWVMSTKEAWKFLAQQQRNLDVFQVRISRNSEKRFQSYQVQPNALRSRIDSLTRRVKRRLVRLDSSLAAIEGWDSVATAIEKRLRRDFGGWQIVLRPLRAQIDTFEDPELLPYPTIFPRERRMEFRVHPEPVLGRVNVRLTAVVLIDFLDAYLYQDDID